MKNTIRKMEQTVHPGMLALFGAMLIAGVVGAGRELLAAHPELMGPLQLILQIAFGGFLLVVVLLALREK